MSPETHEFTLHNGLRVVARQQTGAARTAASLHVGVGFRSEPAGKEGFAHLFEHLMFQGSKNVPKGRLYERAASTAAFINGTTHQDYTDFFHLFPSADLEQVLFSEADRMHAPAFTRESLQEQLRFVQQEIYFSSAGKPYAGFPWPKAPALLFDTHANAHDGFGDMNQLGSISLDDCAEFFFDWYVPSNMVLTVVGDHAFSEVADLVTRMFEGIPTGRSPGVRHEPEGALVEDRFAEFVDEHALSPGVSVSYRIAGPRGGLKEYLSLLAVAHLVNDSSAEGKGSPFDAGVGYFEAFDATDPEVFNIVSIVRDGDTVDGVLHRLQDLLLRLSDPSHVDRLLDGVIRSLRSEYFRLAADPLGRGRFMGKSALLFDSASLIDEIPQAIAKLSNHSVAAAAAALAGQQKAVVVISPRGLTPAGSTGAPSMDVHDIRVPEGHDTLARDLVGRPTPHATARLPERTSGGQHPAPRFVVSEIAGVEFASGEDARTELVELRIQFRLGSAGWTNTWPVIDLLARMQPLVARQSHLGGLELSVELGSGSETILFTGRCEPSSVAAWFSAVAAVLHDAPTAPEIDGPPTDRTLAALSDAIARRVVLSGDQWADESPPQSADGGAWLCRQIFTASNAAVVAVGPVADIDFESAIESLQLPAASTMQERHTPLPVSAAESFPIDGDHAMTTHYFVEPEFGDISAATRYVTAAAYGASPMSRIQKNLALRDAGFAAGGIVTRGTLAGIPNATTRILAPKTTFARVTKELAKEERAFRAYPPGQAELRSVIRYCEDELRSAGDSPTIKADFIARTMASTDKRLRDLSTLDFSSVTPEKVSECFTTLFSGPRITITLGEE